MKTGIYKITCVNNNMIYIGQTTNFKSRKASHLNELKGKRHFNRILQNCYNKYGIESIAFEFILECSSSELTASEQIILDSYREKFPNLVMNLAVCVESFMLGRKHSEHTKELFSKQRQASSNYFYGKKHSEETKKKQSNIKIGKIMSPETKLKQSKARKGEQNAFYGRSHTLESKAKMREAHICKPIQLISPEGVLTNFVSMHEASKITGIARANIRGLLSGRFKQSKGWKICQQSV